MLWFGTQTYTILALANVLFVFFYYSASSPEEKGNKDPLLKENQSLELLSRKQVMLMCVMFFLLVGQEAAYGGWVASYAVMS